MARTSQLLLAGIFGMLVANFLGGSGSPAHARPGEAGDGKTFVVTAPGQGAGNNVLFVVDAHEKKLLVYEYKAGGGKGGKLRFTAGRTWRFEEQFDQWPGDKLKRHEPSVKQMKRQLKKLQEKKDE